MMNKLSAFVTFLLVFVAQQTFASLVTYDFSGSYIVIGEASLIRSDIRDDPFVGRKFNGYVTFDNSDEGYTGCCDDSVAQYFKPSNLFHLNLETTSGSYVQFQIGVNSVWVENNSQSFERVYDGIGINSWTENGSIYQPLIDEIASENVNYFAGVQFQNDIDHSLYSDTKLSNKKLFLEDYTSTTFYVVGRKSSFNGSDSAGWSDFDFLISGGFTSLHERLPTPVDIPATAPLFFTGFLMLLWRRARKNA